MGGEDAGSSSPRPFKKAKVHESEVKKSVTRFEKGGKQFQLVQMLSKYWFIPMMEAMANQELTTEQEQAFDGYRPMKNVDECIKREYTKFIAYIKEVDAREKALHVQENSAEGNVSAAGKTMGSIEFYLNSQSKTICFSIFELICNGGWPLKKSSALALKGQLFQSL